MSLLRFKLRCTGSGAILVFGFATMLTLMLLLAAVGVSQLGDSQRRLENVVSNPLVKISLANRMYIAARERTVNLQRLVVVRDPFERDDQWMGYLGQATEFAQARAALLALPLADDERELLRRQGEFTALAVPIQERVISLIWAGRPAEAQRVLANEAIPAQNRVMEQLRSLYHRQEQLSSEAAAEATLEYRRARVWLLALTACMALLAMGIAGFVFYQARRANLALRDEKERAQVTLHSIGEAVIRTDAGGMVEYLNPEAGRLTGWTQAEACGRTLSDVFRILGESTRQAVPDPLEPVLRRGESVRGPEELLLVTRYGEEHAVELTAAPLRDADDRTTGAVLVFRDVTEVRALSREIVYQATHDLMTGLLNRREFEQTLQAALDDVRRHGVEYALCYLDLDLFKAVNDSCGHLAGDELLKQLSLLLRKVVRKDDRLARIGGDEFAVLMRACTLDRAGEIAEQIRRRFKEYRFAWEDKRMEVGASIGVVRVAADSGDLNDVLRAADVACRVAKEAGRNRVHLFRPNDLTVTRRQREINWVQQIGRAVSEDLFVLYGQWVEPLARSQGKPRHCEILVRLRDESGEVVLPSAFLPAAERYHLMPSIDRWVVRATLRILCAMSAEMLQRFGCFNINLSGQSLYDPEFLEFVLQEMQTSGICGSHICFEITETAAITNLSSATHLMARLKEAGCRFALDDFGSGMSSFTYLKTMPVDFLKIDGAFISNIPADKTDLAMVDSINQVAHIMGIQTIAEYVESDAIREALVTLGVDYGQGYALARPQPLEELLREVCAPEPGVSQRASIA